MSGFNLMRVESAKVALMTAAFAFALATHVWSAPPAAEHAHPDKGPHGGPLLELGDEEYHVEIMTDEKTGTLTLYVLDGEAKAAVATDAKEALINLKHDGKAEQFKLKAAPLKTDPKGQASCFKLKSEELLEDLHDKKSSPRLAIKIKGKSYTAKISLKDDHDHKH
jgi:hypothetical protein